MASTYNLLDYDAEDERCEHPDGSPPRNLFAAARFVQQLLAANDIACAFMGGFSMVCRGSSRTTLDIDVATDATMKQLWAAVEPQHRLVIPNTKLIEGVLRVFVKTGPSQDDDGCSEDMEIETDLAIPGARGTPLVLADHREAVDVLVGNHIQTFYVLDIYSVMRAKLSRLVERDVYDIEFLLRRYPGAVQAVRAELDADDVESFLSLERPRSNEERARFRSILRAGSPSLSLEASDISSTTQGL